MTCSNRQVTDDIGTAQLLSRRVIHLMLARVTGEKGNMRRGNESGGVGRKIRPAVMSHLNERFEPTLR